MTLRSVSLKAPHTKQAISDDIEHKSQTGPVQFNRLPLRPNDPPYSAWGRWGDKDELGTLNLLTPDVVKSAALEIRYGIRVPLNLPLDFLARPMNPLRKPCEHHINAKGYANDDSLHMDTQGSSHFDGLRHVPYQGTLQYYNGVSKEDISGARSNHRLGIHGAARQGIVTRGVLLDWCRYAARRNITYSPFESYVIPLWQLQEVAQEQGVQFRTGDILIIRTGWTAAYSDLRLEDKLALPDRKTRAACGVEASEEVLKWHWENGFAAVATDTVAYEVWPPSGQVGVSMHEVFLSGWGMMIGESWDLEELSRQCESVQKWTFFFSSQPLNIQGGVASPSNAMAIL